VPLPELDWRRQLLLRQSASAVRAVRAPTPETKGLSSAAEAAGTMFGALEAAAAGTACRAPTGAGGGMAR